MAGWVMSVEVSLSSGPLKRMLPRSKPSTELARSSRARAGAEASASFLPMPTYWDPCPGKSRMRLLISSPSHDVAAPRHPSAHGGQGDEHAGLEPTLLLGVVQGQGNGCRRGVAEAVHVDDH